MPFASRLSVILVVCGALNVANAFTAPPSVSRSREGLTPLQLSKHGEPEFIKEAIKGFGLLSLGSMLAFNVADASASTYIPDGATMRKCLLVLLAQKTSD